MTNASRISPIEESHFWFRGRDLLFRQLLEPVPMPSTIVDLGCGTGWFASSLQTAGGLVVGIDLHVPRHPPDGPAFVAGSAEHIPLADSSCDVVLARDVLEHLDDHRSLAEAHRILRPGGRVIAAVPAWPALWSERDEVAEHERRYRRRELRLALERAGFGVEELRGYQLLLLPVLAASRVVARWRPTVLRHEERVPKRVNELLAAVTRFEVRSGARRWLRPPTGSSYVAVGIRHG